MSTFLHSFRHLVESHNCCCLLGCFHYLSSCLEWLLSEVSIVLIHDLFTMLGHDHKQLHISVIMLWYLLISAKGPSRSESRAISSLDAQSLLTAMSLHYLPDILHCFWNQPVSCMLSISGSSAALEFESRILSASLNHPVVRQSSMAPWLNSSVLACCWILTAMNLHCVTFHSMEFDPLCDSDTFTSHYKLSTIALSSWC